MDCEILINEPRLSLSNSPTCLTDRKKKKKTKKKKKKKKKKTNSKKKKTCMT
jgi:hypothetical protein